jgi:hypothetical protein
MDPAEYGEPIRSQLEHTDRQWVVEQLQTIDQHGKAFVANHQALANKGTQYYRTPGIRFRKKPRLLEELGKDLGKAAEFLKTNSPADIQTARGICDFIDRAYGGPGIFHYNPTGRPQGDSQEKRRNEALERMKNGTTLDWHVVYCTSEFLKKKGNNGFQVEPVAEKLSPETIWSECDKVDITKHRGNAQHTSGDAYKTINEVLATISFQDKVAAVWDAAHAIEPGERRVPQPLVRPLATNDAPVPRDPFGLQSGERPSASARGDAGADPAGRGHRS